MLTPPLRSKIITLSKFALGLFWLALFTATHIPPTTHIPMAAQWGDKVLHFSAYLLLALLLAMVWELAGGVLTTRHLVFAWLAILAYGAFDELSQMLVDRDCEFFDWIADATGAAVGLTIFVVLRRLFTRFASPPASNRMS